jgi:Tol biopolymer transport system component
VRRRLDELEGRVIPGTEREQSGLPFYSPDGESILFGSLTDFQLKRVDVEGGTPLPIAMIPGQGWQWGKDGMIYTADTGQISRLSPDGGDAEVVLADDTALFVLPEQLPGGDALLFEQRPAEDDTLREVAVYSLQTKQRITLFPGEQPQYLEPGYIVYTDPSLGLMARAFDADTFAFGGAAALVDDVFQLAADSTPLVRVSASGSLVYLRGELGHGVSGLALTLLSQDGETEPLDAPTGEYRFPSVSPDGTRLAIQTGTGDGAELYLYDLSGETEMRPFTFEGANRHPSWSADGRWIAFSSNRDGSWRIYRKRADGTGAVEPLTEAGEGVSQFYPVFAPDGRLTYVQEDEATQGNDTYIMEIPDGTPELLIGGEGDQGMVSFAPNGEAFAYQSTPDPGGIGEIFVEAFPPDGRRIRVSTSGQPSLWPVWSSDGGQLNFWLLGSGFGAVDFDPGTFSIRNRRLLLSTVGPTNRMLTSIPGKDELLAIVTPFASASNDATPSEIVVVTNWVEEVEARVPPIER